jgi:putative nucleotidyltransferase with HDIG domain
MHLSPRAQAFVSSVTAVGAVILAFSLHALLFTSSTTVWVLLVGLAGITGSFMIKLPRIETRFSLSDTLLFLSVLVLGPACAAVAAAVDALAASLRFNKRDALFTSRLAFNATAAAISVWVPAQLFVALGGQALAAGAPLEARTIVLPLAVLVGGYSLLNTGAIAMVLTLTARVGIATVWRENFAWVWVAHAWSGLVAAAIAIYIPHINPFSLLLMLIVGTVGYATVRVYLQKAEESTDRLHKLNDLYLATIRALAMAIDAKDQVTHGHIRRVQTYAVGLARALGVSDELTLKGIEAGALLHDTGKIAVPEHILNKPGKLNAQEYERMKTHVTIGAEILSGIDFPYPVIPLVRHHHENWDGTGYPDRLRGEAIPLGARILSVVDCFDALTSDRPYRRALTTENALDILRERSGTMYDPRVVERFIEIYPELTTMLAADEGADRPAEPGEPMEHASQTGTVAGEADGDRDLPLADLPRLAALGLGPAEVALLLIHRLQGHLPFSTAAVYAPRATDDRLDPICVSGSFAEVFRQSRIRTSEGLSGWVAAHGQYIVNGNPALDLLGPVALADVGLSSALVVPFTAAMGARGALALYADTREAFTREHLRLACAAATHLSRALVPAATGGAPVARIRAA